MIPVTEVRWDSESRADDWQGEVRSAIRSSTELARAAGVDLPTGGQDFPVFVPGSYLRRIEHGNPADPLLRQVWPASDEDRQVAGFLPEPLEESESHTAVPGLLHKYQGRALVVATGACAIHCRYCFRRSFPYPSQQAGTDRLPAILGYLEAHPDVQEVILSGGDPLMQPDRRLDDLLTRLEALPHIRTVRIHTRFVVAIPTRITRALVARLEASRLRVVIVHHANHPNEIDREVLGAFELLNCAKITQLNQSVLLRGVNDSARVLARLSERLFDGQVLPYYLHLLDRVAGAAHFEVPEAEAKALHRQLRNQLPGYLVPRLAREQPGATAKTLLA